MSQCNKILGHLSFHTKWKNRCTTQNSIRFLFLWYFRVSLRRGCDDLMTGTNLLYNKAHSFPSSGLGFMILPMKVQNVWRERHWNSGSEYQGVRILCSYELLVPLGHLGLFPVAYRGHFHLTMGCCWTCPTWRCATLYLGAIMLIRLVHK